MMHPPPLAAEAGLCSHRKIFGACELLHTLSGVIYLTNIVAQIGLAGRRWGGMSSCIFCRKGRVKEELQDLIFRQWSDKGYIRCEAMVMLHVCESCGMRSLDEGADKVMDEAFQREYRELP
jgi:hypothetical protein